MTDDRRSHRRRDAFKFGTLTLGDAVMECLVWDVSDSGAHIEVETPDIPDAFILVIGGDPHPRRCRIVRREGRRIAIAFEEPEAG